MKDVLTGRADLARAYLSGGDELQKAVAGLLGFESLTPRVHWLEAGSRIGVQSEPSFTAPVEPESLESTVNLPFWQPTSFQVFESAVRACGNNWLLTTIETTRASSSERDRPWNSFGWPLE